MPTIAQTQPAVPVDNDGNALDIWLQNGQILRPDGTAYRRDWQSISTASQLYISDSVNFLSDKATFTFGVRAPRVSRNLTSNANETFTTGTAWCAATATLPPQAGCGSTSTRPTRSSSIWPKLPCAAQLRAHRQQRQPRRHLTCNCCARPRRDLGDDRPRLPLPGQARSLSATLFNSETKNRQSNAFDPVTQNSTYQNVGRVNNRGLELEAGSAPFLGGFTAYGSLTVQKTKVKDDFQASATVSLPTTGKQLTLTPETMIGASLQYASGLLYARLKAKHPAASTPR